MFKRKGLLLTIVLFIALLLSGCIEQNTHVEIHADGTATLTQDVAITGELLALAESEGEDGTNEMMKELESQIPDLEGIEAEEIDEKDRKGVKVTQKFDDVASLFKSQLLEIEGTNGVENPWTVKVDEGFFATNISIKGSFANLELVNLGDLDEGNKEMTSAMENYVDVKFSITTPVQARSHNADEHENRTYTWDLVENKEIQLEYHVLNVTNVIIVSVVGLIVLVVVVFAIKKSLKNRNQNNDENEVYES